MTKTKLPKGWTETSTYRCYTRKFGPLTCRVMYSCISQTFNVDLVAGYDTLVQTLYRGYEPDRNTFDDFDKDVLTKMTFEVKQLIRKWAK